MVFCGIGTWNFCGHRWFSFIIWVICHFALDLPHVKTTLPFAPTPKTLWLSTNWITLPYATHKVKYTQPTLLLFHGVNKKTSFIHWSNCYICKKLIKCRYIQNWFKNYLYKWIENYYIWWRIHILKLINFIIQCFCTIVVFDIEKKKMKKIGFYT